MISLIMLGWCITLRIREYNKRKWFEMSALLRSIFIFNTSLNILGVPGVKLHLPPNPSYEDVFNIFFGEDLVIQIVTETNR